MNTFGIQRLLDSNQRVFGDGSPVYYVYDNFALSQPSELGLSYAPNSGGGTTTVLIDPPPQVSALSMNFINTAISAGVNLRQGSYRFTVSTTWVVAEQAAREFATPQQVFEDASVEGLRYLGVLYNIQKATPNQGVGGILSWDVLCNAPDA